MDVENIETSSDTRRIGRGWIFLGFLLCVTVAMVTTLYYVNKVITDSNLCVNCHEMRPEYYTWANSTHNEIKCTDCHLPVNEEQRIIRNIEGIKQVVKHFAGTDVNDITVWQKVSNENCLQCHSKNRVATPSGDIIISHSLHDQHNVECISCHSGVVHGRIVEREEISKLPRENWTNFDGHQQSTFTYTKPKMIQCLQCHRQWKVSTKCEQCHKKIPTPPSHQPDTWQNGHGQEAWEDVNRCSTCHWEQGINNTFDKKAVAQYIRSNPFCYNCHISDKPSSHEDGWAHDHALRVNRGEVPYCIVCHDVNGTGDESMLKGTNTYCNQCHGIYSVGGRLSDPIWIE